MNDRRTGWRSKDTRAVDEVARDARDDPEGTLARFFMMTTRQLYELLGMPDHRLWDGEAGEECAWHFRTGIDGTCLVVTFGWNMARKLETLPCARKDDEGVRELWRLKSKR